ncbi:hypothetical protein MUB24_22730 [Lederbergia sp. NSJ-179]|uniref:hypothetical protein n=1 Tax=Lederbergia sp. NSJ-179 TaxID=2931402 RepID=UPI001FD2814E|nr:hypothetical protein [Lederbergia sp. NSJ-179]MCJ7843631.1 hypothetical protein [Lederbergia sp. NSJ-179]
MRMEISKKIGIASTLSLALVGLSVGSVSAAENENRDLELWNEIAELPSSIDFKTYDDGNVTTYDSIKFKNDGSGSTSITATPSTFAAGYPISKVQAVGKTTSKVILATHGVTLQFMRNGSIISTKKDNGVGKSTSSATLSTNPGTVQPGTEYRGKSHHTLSTSKNTYSDDTGAIYKF